MEAYIASCELHHTECIYEVALALGAHQSPRSPLSPRSAGAEGLQSMAPAAAVPSTEIRLAPPQFYGAPHPLQNAEDARLSVNDVDCLVDALAALCDAATVQDRVRFGSNAVVRVLDCSAALRDGGLELETLVRLVETWLRGVSLGMRAARPSTFEAAAARQLLLGAADMGLTSAHIAALRRAVAGTCEEHRLGLALLLSENAAGFGGPSNTPVLLRELAGCGGCLRHLNLSGCGLECQSSQAARALSHVLHGLPRLETLSLARNPRLLAGMSPSDARKCFNPGRASHMAELRRLDLSDCGLGHVPGAVAGLAQMLLSNASLEWVNLRSNSISLVAAHLEPLGDVILQCTNIAVLLLGDNHARDVRVDADAVTNLMVALGSNKALQMVDLSGIPLQPPRATTTSIDGGGGHPQDVDAEHALFIGALTDFMRGSPALKVVYLTLPPAVDSPTRAHIRGQLHHLQQPPMRFANDPAHPQHHATSTAGAARGAATEGSSVQLPPPPPSLLSLRNKPRSGGTSGTPHQQRQHDLSPVTPSATETFEGFLRRLNKDRQQRGLFPVSLCSEFVDLEAARAFIPPSALSGPSPPRGAFEHLMRVAIGTGVRLPSGSPRPVTTSSVASRDRSGSLGRAARSTSGGGEPPAAPLVFQSVSPDPEPAGPAPFAPQPTAPVALSGPHGPMAAPEIARQAAALWASAIAVQLRHANVASDLLWEATSAKATLLHASALAVATVFFTHAQRQLTTTWTDQTAALEQRVAVVDDWARRVGDAQDGFVRREAELMQQHERDVDALRFLEVQNSVLQRRVAALLSFSGKGGSGAGAGGGDPELAVPLQVRFAADVAALSVDHRHRDSPPESSRAAATPAAPKGESKSSGAARKAFQPGPLPIATTPSATPRHRDEGSPDRESVTAHADQMSWSRTLLRLSREALEQQEFKECSPRRREAVQESPTQTSVAEEYVDEQVRRISTTQGPSTTPLASAATAVPVPQSGPSVSTFVDAAVGTTPLPADRKQRDASTSVEFSASTQTSPVQAQPDVSRQQPPPPSQHLEGAAKDVSGEGGVARPVPIGSFDGRSPSPLPRLRQADASRGGASRIPPAGSAADDEPVLLRPVQRSVESIVVGHGSPSGGPFLPSLPRGRSASPEALLGLQLHELLRAYPRFRVAYDALPHHETRALEVAWAMRFDTQRRQADMFDVLQRCCDRGMFTLQV